MAVTSVQAIIPDEGGSEEQHASLPLAWLVTVDDPADTLEVVSAATAVTSVVPRYGDWISGTTKTVKSINWERPSPRHFLARVTADNSPFNVNDLERYNQPNPLLRQARVSKASAEFQVYRWKDLNGEAYVNSAGHPLQIRAYEQTRPVYTIRKNVSGVDSTWAQYENTVNSASMTFTDGNAVWALLRRQGLIKRITHGEIQTENGITFYEAICEIHIDGRTFAEVDSDEENYWKEQRLDVGFLIKDGTDSKRITVKDNAGNDQDSPVEHLLNGAGGLLGSGDDPVFLDFDEFKERNHKVLPFFS